MDAPARLQWALVVALVLGIVHAVGAHGGPAFKEPPLLQNFSDKAGVVEVALTAMSARVSLIPGQETEALTYNGTVPGPTLVVNEGDRVIVRFRNELPHPTTVHWHGIHLPFVADGSPFHPVAPGEEIIYEFVVKSGSAGTYWYHPHPHQHTAEQVARGLYGAVIVRDPNDSLPPMVEKLLILSDNRFRMDGAFDFARKGSRQARADAENGREGDILFVNGQIKPELDIAPGEVQRWRVLNASAARIYRLVIPGQKLLHVGSDGGLFEHPIEKEELLLAAAERAELLVHGAGDAGESTVLQSLPYNRYLPQTRPPSWTETLNLLTLNYTGDDPHKPLTLPETLRPVVPLDPAEAGVYREMVLTKNRINGQMMDMHRIDAVAEFGATEIWEIENLVGMDHSFHLHGIQFQVLDRDGKPEPQPMWKDTVNVPKRSTTRIIVRFDTFDGKWMFHCHILSHEDAGMMGVLEVRPAE